ncbi:unnamed protein product [Clonostachys byssicola]|uniref:Uncharacterized protein n=1 Tax=Clonostachys byssicola TaxID=160290 RepID=A0A9N9UWC0_9HYPO|nr:unnamed protein product [Clonostachys byssicola]
MATNKEIDVPSVGEQSSSPSEHGSVKSPGKTETNVIETSPRSTAPPLSTTEPKRMELGDIVLRFLGIRKGPRHEKYNPDAIATQPSIWDSEKIEELKELYIHPKWENWPAFDPNFRWTWKEETAVRHKVDWKIMVWACVMFTALNIDRGNIKNAVSDNMLDDLGLTKADYNLGQTISRVGFLVAELPSQLISKRYYYWYTGTALPIRLAWFWMSSQIADICVGFAAVGLVSMRGILGYEGWRWLFLIEGAFTFLIGVLSFFLMPQCPTRTKSWWNPKGYFTEKEQKIIVNSVIRDDPQKGGMYNRQGLSVRQIWECAKDYDMWPLYVLGLLFGLPKYPVDQYLTLSFRSLGFNVIHTNLLSIPYIVGSSITMLLITALSELVNNRSFVAMAEDAWLLPCFIALIALPDPISAWAYFAISTVLLSFPYTHPIQVAWTSRNAGSVQNRTVSASSQTAFFIRVTDYTTRLYNMWVQVSGMIGANIYQSSDSPRYYKANKGLLVICIYLCFVQYPGTYFYYRWRNNQKAKKWDAMTPDEQHEYRATTTDVGNKRYVLSLHLLVDG